MTRSWLPTFGLLKGESCRDSPPSALAHATLRGGRQGGRPLLVVAACLWPSACFPACLFVPLGVPSACLLTW